MTNNEWKQHLLGSSLPLEHLTTQSLEELGLSVTGPFRYLRPNEAGVPTEFSVDLAASYPLLDKMGPWAEFRLLAECKYASPEVRWVFAPLPSDSRILLSGEVVSTLQSACCAQAHDLSVRQYLEQAPICGRAVALTPKGAVATAIDHGLYQLRYAIPHFVAQALVGQHSIRPEYGLVQLVLPALVTTAPLWVLKRGTTLDDFRNASDLGQVAELADAIIGYEEPGPILNDFALRAGESLLRVSRTFGSALDAVHKYAMRDSARGVLLSETREELLRSFPEFSRRVAVINYAAITAIVQGALDACHAASDSWQRFGTFVDQGLQSGLDEGIVLEPWAADG